MRRRAAVFERTYRYFILTVLFSALVFVPLLWVQFVGVGTACISFGFAVVSFAEYYIDKRIERNTAEREQALYEEHYEDNLKFKTYQALSTFAAEIRGMSDKQLAMTPVLADVFDHWGAVQEQGYYFSKALAKAIIFGMSETKFGYTYLPSQHGLPSGSHLQNAVRAVTDELIRRDCAQRENNKPNGRAYLTVSQEAAMDALYPGGGEE